MGFAAAREFLTEGYHVIIACRNPEKAEKAKSRLTALTGKNNIESSLLDLASLKQIRQSVNDLQTPVDILVCNAGVSYNNGIRYSADGFEETFGVNYLGHFLLTILMLQKFSNTLKRIVVVSSNLHNPKTSAGMFPAPSFTSIEELAYPSGQVSQDPDRRGRLAYVNSKLCNVLFTYKLDELLKLTGRQDVLVNAFNPGFIPDTNLGRDSSPSMKFMLRHVLPRMKLLIREIRTAEESAKNLKRLIMEVTVSGKYFDGPNETASSPLSYDRDLSSRLWDASTKMTGLLPHETIT